MRKSQKTFRHFVKILQKTFDIFGEIGVNQGMILENMVAQMLVCRGYSLFFHEYFYRSEQAQTEKKYEIDFLLVKNRRLCPLEVKSSSYKNHKSFDYFIKKYQLKVNERYIIYTKDLRVENGITYLPVYMTMFL